MCVSQHNCIRVFLSLQQPKVVGSPPLQKQIDTLTQASQPCEGDTTELAESSTRTVPSVRGEVFVLERLGSGPGAIHANGLSNKLDRSHGSG